MCPTRSARLRSFSPSIISTREFFRTSRMQDWTPQRRYRCRPYRSWCTWVEILCDSPIRARIFWFEIISAGLVSLLGSGAVSVRSDRIWKDFGFLSSPACPPAAACKPGLQGSGHLPDQRTGQPGTHTDCFYPSQDNKIYWMINCLWNYCGKQ